MKRILKSIKKLVSMSVVALSLYGLIAGGANALASGPVFNQLPGDQDFTVGRTQNQQSFSDPVTATTADRVTVAVYYHNNTQDSTATNVTIKSALPSAVASQHVIHTTLSADNASSITNTVVNGQVVGQPDLTINLDQAAGVSYVPGSTYWFPDLQQNPNQTGVPMPDGITGNGLNIGNIDGCWSHAGFVEFDVIFNATPQLQTDKWVALYGGNNQWVKQNTANPGDQLRYQIYYNNPGTGVAKNTLIVDTLPNEVSYVPESIVKRVKDQNNNDIDILIPDSAVTIAGHTITIPLGDVLPNQNNSGFISMRVKVDTGLGIGTHTLINNETLKADTVAPVSASAQTTVVVNPSPVSDVKILKEVANLSQGSQNWVKSNTGKPGDHMQYRLTVYNQGTLAAQNVSVVDHLPNNVSYVAGSTKIFTTDPTSGQSLPDGVTNGGVTIGTIQNGVPNGNRYVVFDVTIAPNLSAGNTDLVNNADVLENGVKKDTSSATTTVTSQVGLILTKEAWNASTGQWVTTLHGVKPGDVVIYRIMVRNTGNTQIDNPVIKDTLPTMVTYIPGSTQMDGSVQVNDQWITNGTGILIANVTPGNFKTITFRVTVAACPPGGTFTLTNVANVTATGMSAQTAQADIIVSAGPPNIPR